MHRRRIASEALPSEIERHRELAYSLWLPEIGGSPKGGVVILHGAGSCKESHHDFARVVLGAGLAAIAFDQRGHGATGGRLDGRVVEDTIAIAELLRSRIGGAPIALRGSSMGGYLSIVAAAPARAAAIVAICPASAAGLRSALAAGALRFEADVPAVDRLLAEHELDDAVASLQAPLLILHAEGDEQVPVQQSRELERHFALPGSRLITVPGGHHRSVQHDHELQAVSLRFIEQALAR